MFSFDPFSVKREINPVDEMMDQLFDSLSEAMLKSSMPEAQKVDVCIMRELKRHSEKMRRTICPFGKPVMDDDVAEALFSQRKEVLNFLQAINKELDAFAETHPVPAVLKNHDNDL